MDGLFLSEMRHAPVVRQFPINVLLPSKGRRFAPPVVIGNKRLTRLFPGECAVTRAEP